jgi:hypothetical protein
MKILFTAILSFLNNPPPQFCRNAHAGGGKSVNLGSF